MPKSFHGATFMYPRPDARADPASHASSPAKACKSTANTDCKFVLDDV